jgi:hypothetical protein
MRIGNDSLSLNGVDVATTPVSMGASFNLDAVYLAHIVNFAIQLVFTGTPDGTLTLQASNDKGLEDKPQGGWDARGVTHWTTILGSDQAIAAAGNHMWDVQNCGYRWVRVVYTRNASTGSLTSATMNVKGV